tara:strand:- start:2909 stop:3115 length:207 start_codon:yes stop_codon:yes gene_type:complete
MFDVLIKITDKLELTDAQAEQLYLKCLCLMGKEKTYCNAIINKWVKMMQSNNKEYAVKRNGEVIEWEI